MQHTTPHQTSQGTQNPNATAVCSIGLLNKDYTKYTTYQSKKVNKKEEIENITDYF